MVKPAVAEYLSSFSARYVNAKMRIGELRQFLHQGIRFLLGSLAGLICDLTLFELFIWLGALPALANAASSAVGVTVAYLLVTKYAFGTRRSKKTYLAFVTWYALSIILFSFLIQLTAARTGWPPLVSKLASLPFSFSANFAFSRFLFRNRGSDEHRPQELAAPAGRVSR